MSARNALVALLVFSLAAAGVAGWSAPSATAGAQGSPHAVAALQARVAAPLRAYYDPRYGNVAFLMGRPLYTPSAAARGSPSRAALEFLATYPELYQMKDPARELSLVRTTSDSLGQTHVRFQQQAGGVPVFARSLYVHLDADGNVIGTNGHFVPGIHAEAAPAVSARTAETLALRAAGTPGAAIGDPTALTMYIDDAGSPHLAWQVDVWDARAPSRAWHFIAARDGALLGVVSTLRADRFREIYDAGNREDLPGELIGREGEMPRDAAGASAYAKIGAVYDYYLETHQRDSFDDRGAKLRVTVHYSQDYNWNFWDGHQIVFGDPDTRVRGASGAFALDVVAHETTHAVNQYSAGFVYRGQSGALDESFADLFGVMLDREDWHYSEDTPMQPPWPTPWAHDLEDPSLGGHYDPADPWHSYGQPSKMSEFANLPLTREWDWGGVHINGGITSHAAYLVAQNLGGDVEGRVPVEHIWYRALTTYLTETSDFWDFARSTLQAARDLEAQYPGAPAAVEAALEAVELSGEPPATPAPSPTPTARRSPAPQPTPEQGAGCSELVRNRGFESSTAAPWVEHSALSAVSLISGLWPHTGEKSVWLGGQDQESFQYIYQDVTIPANAQSVTLTYWRLLHRRLRDQGAHEATFEALAADTSGRVVAVLESFSDREADDAWRQSTVDLRRYAGKTVRLAFTANMADANLSSFFVDDVSALACTAGHGNPTPTPAPGGGIRVAGRVVSYETGAGVPGATVFVIRPGITATGAMADGSLDLRREVLTIGVGDEDGVFSLMDPLQPELAYSLVVQASGYYDVVADGALDTRPWGPVTEYGDLQIEMQPVR